MKLGVSLGAIVLLLGNEALAGPPPGPASDESTPVVASSPAGAQQSRPLDKSGKAAVQDRMTKLLVSKPVKSRIDFPGYKDGISLSPAGGWNLHETAKSIEEHGIGVQKGDQAKITAIKLHDDYIEIHLDGGGAGVFAQGFGPDRSQAAGKVEGGSRINLRFERPITPNDVHDLGRFLSYLEPVIDTAEIQQNANMAATLAPVPTAAPAQSEAPRTETPANSETPAKTETPAPAVAQASTFGAPILDPVPAATPAKAKKSKSRSGVAPIESKAAEIPSVPAPAAAPPAAPAAASSAPAVTAVPKLAPKQIAATKIEAGMERMAVFQLLGQPGYKRVDVSKELPIEKWQYDLPGNGKRIITFENGTVLRVEDF